MKIGLCVSVDKVQLARDAGFDFIEENIQNLFVAEQPEEAFAPKLKAVNASTLPVLAANGYLPPALKCVGPDVDDERLDRYAANAFRRANEANVRLLVFGSGGARQIPDGFSRDKAREQFLAYLKRLGPIAQKENVTVLIECLNSKECNFINKLSEGASLVKDAAHPNVQLLADIFHMMVDNDGPEEIVKYGSMLRHVHVAELKDRQAPGTAGEDFGPYLRALKQANYQGDLSFECAWKNLSEQAAGSFKSFREQAHAAGLV